VGVGGGGKMRIYATTDDGRRILCTIRCDGVECDLEIKPRPDISHSGWMKHGLAIDRADWLLQDYCPDCQRKRP
jgi:hypothetical protein